MNQRYGANRGASKWSWIGLVVLILLCGIVYYLWQQRQAPEPAAPEPAAEQIQVPAPVAVAPSAPAIEHPLPAAEPVVPGAPELPALESSDSAARDALASVLSPKILSDWLFATELIRRVVVTVDNLPRESLPMSLRLVKAVPGGLVTTGGDDKTLAAENYARYTGLLKLCEAVSPRALAEVYIRFYPLLQQQYRSLGYPDAYFNDAMVRAIDSLMRTPDIREPIRLVQPKVLYKFADPTLENLSIGQRMMLRMGPDNVARAKQVLRAFRQEITGRAPKP